MDDSWEKWLSDLEVEDCNVMGHSCIHRYKYSYDPVETTTPDLEITNFQPCLSSESDSCKSSDPSFNAVSPFKIKDSVASVSNSPIDDRSFESQRPTKQHKSTATLPIPIPADTAHNRALASPKSPSQSLPKSYIISFDKPSSTPAEVTEHLQSAQACDLEGSRGKVGNPSAQRNLQYCPSDESNRGSNPTSCREKRGRSSSRSSYHSKDHIMAERKRRENLSLRFIALSATIPGLKKTDKASVLGDAIRYVKQLQERVKELEEDASKSRVESVVSVKKSVISAEEDMDDEYSLGDDNSEDGPNFVDLPEVEVRVSGKNILVRIHCLRQKGLLEKLLREIEDLHLVVINSIALPFGNSIHDITIVAQMDVEYNMTVKELVKHMRVSMSNFIGV